MKEMKQQNWDNIKAGAFFTAFILGMLWVGYEFGTMLSVRINDKKYLDSLKVENLKLDNELLRKKIESLK